MLVKNIFYSVLLTLCLLAAANQETSAQSGTVRGFVVDSTSGEALAGASIVVQGTSHGAAADLNGYFSIPSVPTGNNIKVIATFMGYRKKVVAVNVLPGKITQVKIELEPGYLQLETVEAIGKRGNREEETVGLDQISIKEIELMPKSVETDIMRSLQFLPGVKSTSDISARYYVRGGGSDQNLVLFNGVSVYNPFHAMGLFSIIDPEMINAVEFYKGGFPAEYGGRLSSILNLVTKDGNKNHYSGTANLSMLTGKASLEGPLPSGSFILTGRKSLFSDILEKFLRYKDARFQFHDISFKANFASTGEARHTKISLFGFSSMDEMKNRDEYKESYYWKNDIYGINWLQVWENPLYSETIVALSSFSGEVKPNKSDALQRLNKVRDFGLKTDFTYMFDSRDEIKFGYNFSSFKSDMSSGNLQKKTIAISDNGAGISLYTKYRLLRFEGLAADVGTRINAASMASQNEHIFEPRVNLTYKFSPLLTIKGAWGIYSQDVIALSNENDVVSLFEPWVLVPDYLKAPESIHYIAGIETNLSAALSLKAETYYKVMRNLIELNDNAGLGEEQFLPAKGESYGWEFLLQYAGRDINFTCGYSLSWAYKEINGWLYYPRYDSRHSVNTSLAIDFGKGWQGGILWMFSSGLPFSQIESFYDKYYFENLFDYSSVYESYSPYTILGDKNLGRLPYYHRLDLSLTKDFRFYFTNLSFSLNVINAYNRKNIFYFERDTGRRVNMLPVLPTASLKIEI